MSEQAREDTDQPGRVLIECRALMMEAKEIRRWQTLGLVTRLVSVAFLLISAGFSAINVEYFRQCCWIPFLSVSLLFAWMSILIRCPPANRGRLQLQSNQLVFGWRAPRVDPVGLLLEGFTYIRRQRHWVVVVAKGEKYWFECARLHGEDLFDQLRERLEELQIEVVAKESDRSGILGESLPDVQRQ